MIEDKAAFKGRVYKVVSQIPVGCVASYGQVAVMADEPAAAWEVGQIAHLGPSELPWHRVVRKDGGMASGFPGGPENQQRLLELENIQFNKSDEVLMDKFQWQPENHL